ncbi:NADH dehydrogenase [ubiquinone] 1 alpha subcomplex assembly factor 3 isoform X2 [Copidosoma floridanum]|nr:NADH dehydrogenase [ubiquinone] 1 alpha subcomplex assembly factor 3 isoform X2 [Copidosoma floridanum]
MIDNVSEYGFILNNGIKTIGPMIIFPKTMLSWNIARSSEMNEKSFSLLFHLEPKLDICVVGLDDDYPRTSEFLQNLHLIFKKYQIPAEILPVHQACSTFNFLNAENRYAAAALIPPKVKCPKDMLLSNYNKKHLEEIEKKSDPFYTHC